MFFCVYVYNMLVILWGDVFLVIEFISILCIDYICNVVVEVDGVIDFDLVYVMFNFLVVGVVKNESCINQDMVRQLVGEVYFWMGMCDVFYFKKVEDVVMFIIIGGKYELILVRYGKYVVELGDYYYDMFCWGNQCCLQGNMEVIWIFEMEYNCDVNGGIIDNL